MAKSWAMLLTREKVHIFIIPLDVSNDGAASRGTRYNGRQSGMRVNITQLFHKKEKPSDLLVSHFGTLLAFHKDSGITRGITHLLLVKSRAYLEKR